MRVFEINDRLAPDGRRRFKASLHEIYPDESFSNKNGICYLQQYTEANMQTAIEMPICCEFVDAEKRAPMGHGFTGRRTRDGLSLFEDSVVVGCVDRVWIDDIQLNDRTARVLMSEGVLYEQRYPELIDWMRAKLEAGMDIQGSVEFVGTAENDGYIKYLNDYDGDGRIPVEYCYSGFCLLSVPPADDAAIVLELNQKERDYVMDEQTRKEICAVINEAITQMNADRAAADEEINAARRKVEECEQLINELNSQIQSLQEANAQLQDEINQKAQEAQSVSERVVVMTNELNAIKVAEAQQALSKALAEFSETQRSVAEAEIRAFNENPLEHASEINMIVDKVAAAAYRVMKQANAASCEMQTWDMSGFLSNIDPIPEGRAETADTCNFDPQKDFAM